MRIRSVTVEGFRNIRRKVRLDGLGPLNVLHGDNNVGKSNLVEAIELVFTFLQLSGTRAFPVQGVRAVDIFNIADAAPRATVQLDIQWDDAEQASLGPRATSTDVLTWEAQLLPGGMRSQSSASSQNPQSISLATIGLPSARPAEPLFLRIAPSRHKTHPTDVLARLRHAQTGVLSGSSQYAVEALQQLSDLLAAGGITGRSEIVPQDLLVALLDARDAGDKPMFERWRLFLDLLQGLSDLTGEGEFVAAYDRANGLAELFFETSKGRLPVDRLGTGIQQLVALVGRLVVTRASVVAIEEPELNLRYDLQLRLRDVLARIVEDGRGPEQILLTSHSPAFEWGDHFWFMKRTDAGPVVEKHSIRDAHELTQHRVDEPPPGAHAPLSYVTSEGILHLSKKVRGALGIPNGGSVALIENEDARRCEIISSERFFEELEGEQGGAPPPSVRRTGS